MSISKSSITSSQSNAPILEPEKHGTLHQLGANAWDTVREKVPDIAKEVHNEHDHDEEAALRSNQEAIRALEMIKQSEFFKTLPAKTQRAITMEYEKKSGVHKNSDDKSDVENVKVDLDKSDASSENSEDDTVENRKVRDQKDEEDRLGYLWRRRKVKTNWILLVVFHATVIGNFTICLVESYWILREKAKLSRMFLGDDFNCMEIIPSGDTVNNVFSIIHALMCVAVLFADTLHRSNICWGYVFAQLSHAMSETFQYVYDLRFAEADKNWVDWTLFLKILLQIGGILVVVQRYYDMTDVLTKRKQRFTSSIYGGRMLNEQIIYQNESTFLQKKYTQRQATALQIYGIIQKIEHYRTRGLEPDPKDLNIDIRAAIAALYDVQDLDGPEMLKQLRKRNAKRLKELKSLMLGDDNNDLGNFNEKY